MAGVAVRATLTGDKEMKRKLEHLTSEKGLRKEARKATVEVGGEKVLLMKARTPVKTGKLRDSERLLVMVSAKKEDIRISLIAGGPDVLYARKVHEEHKTHSKFMESVILEAAGTAGQEIAAKIDLARAVAP
jgi:bacteriophage HK97-gp10 putative tail-component